MNDYITGSVRRIIFKGENGYTVGVFKVKDATDSFEYLKNTTISFTGYFHELDEDDNYKFHGNIINHPKYGEQFNCTFYERVIPEEKDSIVEFLSSGTFKGIGEKTAEKIVNILGDDALQIIIDNPSNLLLVPGISKKQMNTLHDTLIEYSNSYNIILKLNEYGFTTKDSMIIYNKYKANTLNIVEENIYQIIEDINDIGFKKIDLIAIKMGYSKDDKRRVMASIIYTMEELCNALGHCYLHINDIFRYTLNVLGFKVTEEYFIECLNTLIVNIKVVKTDEKYYLKSMWDAEELIAKRLIHLNKKKDFDIPSIDGYIEELEKDNHIKYNEDQKNAIKNSLIKNFIIITGGPGTGKTTIVSSIIELYRKINKLSYKDLLNEVAVLAPTGRASKRLTEKSLFPASTIHSFLKWNKETDRFQVNEHNKSDVKLVIIDEASMVDVLLFSSLLKGLLMDTRIVMVGDYDQLPSVGPGQLLKDLIESNILNVISLKTLYRQTENSSIITLAHDINNGIIDESIFNVKPDLDFIETKNVLEVLSEISDTYSDSSYNDFQVLVPMYKGINGIDNFNKKLQSIFNPKSKNKKELTSGESTYRECDKVLQLVNMPDDRIFNGDIGIISKIDNKEIVIDFDNNEVRFTPANFSKFKHGYAISIHKSQGSEFDIVVLPVVKDYGKMLYRKLYYTAVTRSKTKLILIGEMDALKAAVKNNNQDIRMTSIKEKLLDKNN